MRDKSQEYILEEKCKIIEKYYGSIPEGIGVAQIFCEEESKQYHINVFYINEALAKMLEIKRDQNCTGRVTKIIETLGQAELEKYYQVAYKDTKYSMEKFCIEMGKYLHIAVARYEEGNIIFNVHDTTQTRVYEDSLKSIVHAYREIYFLRLKEDYYQIIYPDLNCGEEQGCYSKAVEHHFLNQWICDEDKENVEKWLSIENINQILKEQDYVEYKYRRRSPAGELEWCLTSFSVVEREKGEPVTVTLSIRSIDEIVKHEEQQKQLLIDAVKRAEVASQAKSTFLSNVSHDIRTPLNIILGMAKIAKINIEDQKKVQECLDNITVSGNHLFGLINDVLDMSQIESGKMNLSEEEFSLSQLISEVLLLLVPKMEEKKLRYKIDTTKINRYQVIGDALKLKQVLVNLLDNAIKFTQEGGCINFRVKEKKSVMPGKGLYEFVVEDNGIGMSKEFMSRLFEPFARAENSGYSKQEGTGLGLPIAKNIVKMMAGDIRCYSALGKGSKFVVTVYLALSERAQENEKENNILDVLEKKEKKTEDSPHDYSKNRVLIVDDDEMNLDIAEQFLATIGIQVEKASNGKEAFERLLETPEGYFDLIFMDMRMPVMNGYDTTIAIRKQERKDLQSIPIIALTADAFATDIRRAKEAGMDSYLSKPIWMEQLLDCIKQWV